MSHSHTPSPWRIGASPNDQDVTVYAGDRSICDVIGSMPVDLANARLIAAAPIMLAKLEELAGKCGNCDGSGTTEVFRVDCIECRDIRMVIAQAKGVAP